MPGPNDENLGEVERALSVLQGRHPEHERLRREDAAKQAALRASREEAASVAHGRSVRRRLVIGAVSVVVLVFLGTGAFFVRRVLARRAELARVSFPGWNVVEAAHGAVAAKVEPGCLLVASTTGADVILALDGEEHRGASPLVACTCMPTLATVTAGGGGVVLLRAEGREIGGSRAFSMTSVDARTKVTTDAACSEAAFDAWLDAKGHRTPIPDGSGPSGFRPLARLSGSDFAVVDVPAASCVLVLGRARIRLRGGGTPVPDGHGNAAWCTAEAATVTFRDGPGDVFVTRMNDVGGIDGMFEVAPELGRVGTTDRAADARALLLASGVPGSLVTTALTETEKGVEVLGRAGEDAIVAVTLLKGAPWGATYTDGPAWSLDGAPRIVPLAPPARTNLVARMRLPPKATRHSVVFRRRAP